MFTKEELDKRFNFHPATPLSGPLHNGVRRMCRNLANVLVALVPDGREQSLAITHLEEVMYWANAGVARNPVPEENKNVLTTYRAEITTGMREGYDGTLHMQSEVLTLCAVYCDKVGLGVEVHFGWCVYTGGYEPCARVSLINYPRFPSTPQAIWDHAVTLGKKLKSALNQQRFTIVATDKTEMFE